MPSEQYEFQRAEIPVPPELISKSVLLWKAAYDDDHAWLIDILGGSQEHLNQILLYLAQKDNEVVASCRLTISHLDRRLGWLGAVATLPEHRGRHLARRLCSWAAEDFDQANGQGLFLGTGNPFAAKVYSRLGWRFLPGAKVMLRVNGAQLPQEFLVDYFRSGLGLPLTIRPAGPDFWANMIPLLVTGHDWIALDANASMLSTQFYIQRSCEGLYLRYHELEKSGTWFALTRQDGAVVGLASAVILDDGRCCTEAFTHAHYQKEWLEPLYEKAIDWGRSKGASTICTTCAPLDHLKQTAVERLDFRLIEQKHRLQMWDADLELLMLCK